MEFQSSLSTSTLQSVKERIREKLNGSLKAVKLQTSLAAKIKTKTLNNSSILKVSLRHNNKALACALTAERAKSRGLGTDKMLLQKEVNMMHFQIAMFRQNLNIVNKMLKEIDVCMNINLPAAIEISSTMESSDRLSLIERRSERFSKQSALSLEEDRGFRVTGEALRVPFNSVGQQKHNSYLPILVNHLAVPPSPVTNVVRENCEQLDGLETRSLNLSPKERLTVCSEDRSRDSFSNVKVSHSILPLDEEFSPSNRNAHNGGFVTRRKKRSTVSHSSTGSKKSDASQTMSSMGMRRESSPSTQWELSSNVTILPGLGDTGLDGAEKSYIDSVLQKDRLSTMRCSSWSQNLDIDSNSYTSNVLGKAAIPSTSQLELDLNEGSEHHTVHGYVGQEKTVYEADMEMTSSESASIIAVMPKNKTQSSKNKSGIPVKETGTLRKVKTVREKSKKLVNDSSNSSVKGDGADKSIEKVTSDKYYDRRTYVLPGSVVQERLDLESGTQSNLEVSASRESCAAGQISPDNTAVLNGGKSELTFTLQKDHYTEIGNITDTAPKRRSKKIKEASHTECSRKKKSKILKNSKDQGHLAQERDNTNECSEEMDSSKINTILSIHARKKEPKTRRETYIVTATKQTPVTNDLISKVHGVNYRRETFVIPEPNPLVSVTLNTASEVRNATFEEPQNDVTCLIPTDVSHKTEHRSDSEKEHGNAISNPDACDYKKHDSRCSEKKASVLFSELNKRKTHIMPSKQDVRGAKATLVRESSVNLTSSQSDKAIKFPDMANKESCMLDMVSESVLDNTMELSSFAEFPTATNPEDTSTINMSLKSIPAPELPVSEDYNERSHVSNNINVVDENNSSHQQDAYETEIGSNQQWKVEDQSMEIHDAAIKPFQDLTNKSLGSTKPSPKSCSEEGSRRHCGRKRNPVNYKEPSLGKKLRRGEGCTDTALLCSTKLGRRRKSNV